MLTTFQRVISAWRAIILGLMYKLQPSLPTVPKHSLLGGLAGLFLV